MLNTAAISALLKKKKKKRVPDILSSNIRDCRTSKPVQVDEIKRPADLRDPGPGADPQTRVNTEQKHI